MRAMTFHEEASAEVNEAAKYYEDRVPGLGLLFLVALEEAVEKVLVILRHSNLSAARPGTNSSGASPTASCMSLSQTGFVYLRSRIRSVDLDIGGTGCRSAGRLNPRLMVNDIVDPSVVVTVYRTNKIAKYWRRP